MCLQHSSNFLSYIFLFHPSSVRNIHPTSYHIFSYFILPVFATFIQLLIIYFLISPFLCSQHSSNFLSYIFLFHPSCVRNIHPTSYHIFSYFTLPVFATFIQLLIIYFLISPFQCSQHSFNFLSYIFLFHPSCVRNIHPTFYHIFSYFTLSSACNARIRYMLRVFVYSIKITKEYYTNLSASTINII